MTWRAAKSLLVLHQQLKAGSRAAPPATGADEWGLIGDAAHDPTSDHTPHDFPGWGTQIVTAADFPNRPDLGLDAHQVLDDIRRSHDTRVKYGISNGQIFSSYATSSRAAWTWGPYSGTSDMHFTHGHLSVVGDSRADGEQPWQTIGGDDMGARQDAEVSNANRYGWALVAGLPKIGGIYNPDNLAVGATATVENWTFATLGRIEAKADAALKALGLAQADIDELQARPAIDLPALAAALAPLLDGKLDAAAVLGVLQSPEGQAALVQAANTAEDA